MNIINWVRRKLGCEYKVAKATHNNLVPCRIGKYMVYAPGINLVWDINLEKESAQQLCEQLNTPHKRKKNEVDD